MGKVKYPVARVTKTSKREMQKQRKRLRYTTVEDSIILQQKLAKTFLTSWVNIARFLVKKLAANIETDLEAIKDKKAHEIIRKRVYFLQEKQIEDDGRFV